MNRISSLLDAAAEPRFLAFIRLVVGTIAVFRFLRLAIETWQIRQDVPVDHVVAILGWLALAILMAVGWHARAAAAGLILTWFWFLSIDWEFFYWNHHYFLVLAVFLVMLTDCEQHLAVRKVPAPSRDASGWPVFLMRCQVSILYVFAGLAKINGQFLSGDVLGHYLPRSVVPLPLPDDVLTGASFLVPLSIAVVVTELFLGIAPWFARLRPAAFAVALPFQVSVLLASGSWLQFYGVLLFSLTTLTMLMSFLELPRTAALVIWDDTCGFCRRWITAFQRLDLFAALRFAGSSAPAAYEHLGVSRNAAAEALQIVEADGTVRSGFEAVQSILRVLPGGCFVAPWMSLPGVRHLGARTYRRIAAGRTCTYTTGVASTGAP